MFAYEAGGRGYQVRSPDSVRGHTFGTHTHGWRKKATFAFPILIVAQFSAQDSLCLMPVSRNWGGRERRGRGTCTVSTFSAVQGNSVTATVTKISSLQQDGGGESHMKKSLCS